MNLQSKITKLLLETAGETYQAERVIELIKSEIKEVIPGKLSEGLILTNAMSFDAVTGYNSARFALCQGLKKKGLL